MTGEQRQDGVGGGGGDDFEPAVFLEFAEGADNAAAVG
jgi:hypothetical protein